MSEEVFVPTRTLPRAVLEQLCSAVEVLVGVNLTVDQAADLTLLFLYAAEQSKPLERQRQSRSKAKALLRGWAREHQGVIVMRDLCAAAVRSGEYTTGRIARKTLYSEISRNPAEFRKIDVGVYAPSAAADG